MRFTLRVPEELVLKLNELAKKQGYTRNTVIVSACWELVQKYQQEEAEKCK